MRSPTLYIFKDEQLQLVISNEIENSLPLLSCRLKEAISGEVSLTFSIPSDHSDSQYIREGCWVVIRDMDGVCRPFVIIEENEVHDENLIREFTTEELAVNELNDEIVTDVRPQNTDARDALTRILSNAGSRWQVGIVDDLGIASTNVYYESVMSGIQKIIEKWGGEIRFRVTMDSQNRITGRYIDLFKQLGRKTGKRFEYRKDLTKVERYVDMKSLKTALFGRGKGEETDSGEYGRRITFKDVVWSKAKGDPTDKPAGQEWVGDPNALQQWGHWNDDGTRRHRFGVFIDEEETDPAKLLKKTWDHLQTINKPHVTYKMDVIDLEYASGGELKHEAVRLGDSVYVIDKNFAHDIRVEARVIEIDRDLLDPTQTKLVLGNVIGDIGSLVKRLQDELRKKVSVGDPISWLEGAIETENLQFERSGAYVYINNEDGILTTNRPKNDIDNPPDLAVQIRSAGVRIAAGRNPDGSYRWRTLLTGNGLIADAIATGRIRTDSVDIGDDAGRVLISKGNIIIKGGSLEVYSTSDASDNGVLIKGNRITTNFIKNPNFDNTPGEEWIFKEGSRYNSSKKVIELDGSETRDYTGVSQYFDVYHPRATFQALFKINVTIGSTPAAVRFYFWNYDKDGNRLADKSYTVPLPLYQDIYLLNRTIDFPVGTTRSRVYVQGDFKRDVTAAMELHWVKGFYEEYVTQQQIDMIPVDVHSVQAKPEIQQFNIRWQSPGLGSGVERKVGRISFNRRFSTLSSSGRIAVVLTPINVDSSYYVARPANIAEDGFDLWVYTLRSVGSGEREINGLAYRVDYLAHI
ncbi:phage tail protein [Thermoflavimicrobium dichotomicum]|uniref:phage tail protein n=1 Tax=Thermoflavimicrobium dichotomicum TaxID=46223 RepID=UPI001587BCC1|nr:phage tail protein [Thermoflavimicrobium dichotomicum]